MSLFSVGEICEVLSNNGEIHGWQECEIMAIGNPFGLISPIIGYTVSTADLSSHPSGYWMSQPQYLRKKRPPQQDSQVADDEFIEDLKAMIFKPVTTPIEET